MKKFLLIFVVSFVSSIALLIGAQNFLHKKMKEELFVYYQLTDRMQVLNDTYSLCSGLIDISPSKLNIDSCNIVFKEIKKTVNDIEEKCPYITFYTNYISDI